MNREIEKKTCKDCLHYEVCMYVNAQAVEFARAENCKLFADKNGYRNSADVSREIFEEIEELKRYIRLNEDIAVKCKRENGEQNEEYWKGKVAAFRQIRAYIDAELKKKYESEGADDEN